MSPTKSKMNLDQEVNMRERFLFGIGMIVIIFLFFNYFWDPEAIKIKTLTGDLKAAKAQVDSVSKLIEATKSQLVNRPEKPIQDKGIDAKIKKMVERRILDVENEVNSVTELLNKSSASKKIEISNVLIGKKNEEPTYNSVSISLELAGRYASIESFIKMIENMEKPLAIKSFSFTDSQKQKGFVTGKMEIDFMYPKK